MVSSRTSPAVALAVVVTYLPDADFPARAARILEQAGTLVVVDNSPTPETPPALVALGALPGAILLRNGNRGGLAGALNRGADYALSVGAEFVFTFDQDTEIPAAYVDTMLAAVRAAPRVGMLGPVFRNRSTGAPGRIVLYAGGRVRSAWLEPGRETIEAFFVINSGAVIRSECFARTRYREDFLVDFVDIDFCWRLRQQGWEIAVTRAATISHGIGNRRPGSWRFSPTFYPPRRKYLMTRNRIVTWRELMRRFPGFVANDALYCGLDIVRTLLLEPGRGRNFAAFARGIVDGLGGRPVRECYFPAAAPAGEEK